MLIIKEAAMMKKERRTRTKPAPILDIEQKPEIESEKIEEQILKNTSGKEKAELKDIEQKLDELLGE